MFLRQQTASLFTHLRKAIRVGQESLQVLLNIQRFMFRSHVGHDVIRKISIPPYGSHQGGQGMRPDAKLANRSLTHRWKS